MKLLLGRSIGQVLQAFTELQAAAFQGILIRNISLLGRDISLLPCCGQIKLFVVSALLTALNLFQLQQPAKGSREQGRKESNANADV